MHRKNPLSSVSCARSAEGVGGGTRVRLTGQLGTAAFKTLETLMLLGRATQVLLVQRTCTTYPGTYHWRLWSLDGAADLSSSDVINAIGLLASKSYIERASSVADAEPEPASALASSPVAASLGSATKKKRKVLRGCSALMTPGRARLHLRRWL